jgi:glycosyltransferase involved in cell wall biosynthesis
MDEEGSRILDGTRQSVIDGSSDAQARRPKVLEEPPVPPERLREICWDIGGRFPRAYGGHRLILAAARPRQAYVHWSIDPGRVEALKQKLGNRFSGARQIVRVYDVTDIVFNGLNAHMFFDIDVRGLSGSYYFGVHEPNRTLLAELGFWLPDDSFWALARSNTRTFDGERPSHRFDLGGSYVGRRFEPAFRVESVLDAPAFEGLPAAFSLVRDGTAGRVAEVETGFGGSLAEFVHRLSAGIAKFRLQAEHLAPPEGPDARLDLLQAVHRQAEATFACLARRHSESPFDLVHCHDWYSVPVGVRARDSLGLPLVATLHSTEHERAGGHPRGALSDAIVSWEHRTVMEASLVIVPNDGVRGVVVGVHGALPERVTVIPDAFDPQSPAFPDPKHAKCQLGLNPEWPVALFAGELCYASGADILADAIPTVCRDTHAHFVFAGDGPLRWELEARLGRSGVGHRCRFLGDVPADRFEGVLMSADMVVIPARSRQPEALAELALSFGKPVLTTQQARLHSIEHARNGLVTHDNPGSMVWGMRDLLSNPLRGNMMRLLARRRAQQGPSFDAVAVQHAAAFMALLGAEREPTHA